MARRDRAGFTLVELLVVIAIIGVLMGLLLPAVLAARERARVAQCAQRQGELGKAMYMYEQFKKHYPGYANNLRGKRVSWAPLMLPYIDRNDLWEGGWRDGNTPDGYVQQFVCPSDSPSVDSPLSYVVNVGQGQQRPLAAWGYPAQLPPIWPLPPLPPSDVLGYATPYQGGLFRNFTLTAIPAMVSVTDVKSASRRPMIAESAYDIADANNNGIASETTRRWIDCEAPADPRTKVTAKRFGFLFWPGGPVQDNPTAPVPVVAFRDSSTGKVAGAIVPIHKGLVNVTFCDGHTESLANAPDVVCGNFDWEHIK